VVVVNRVGLAGAVLILVVGILSDRVGRKPFLLVYEVLTSLSELSQEGSDPALKQRVRDE